MGSEDQEPEPKLVEIIEVKLHNPEKEVDEHIDKIDIEGDDLANSPYIKERHRNGYITRGFKARMQFDGELFDVAFAGSDMMGYAKVEDVGDYGKAKRLMKIIRERYMTYFRGASPDITSQAELGEY